MRFDHLLPGCASLALVVVAACAPASPVVRPSLKPAGIATDIAYLSSPALTGRESGTPGNDSAAVFLARRLHALGIPGAFPDLCATAAKCGISYFQYFVNDEVRGHNVGAFIRGSDPDFYKEFVVVGAHYDHLGRSPRFALDPELLSSVHPGADDNASGTAALLELARRLAASPPPRSVLIVHFDAEEWGLVGSRAFVRRPPIPVSTIVFMLNLDMVGRLDGRDLLIDGSAADARTRGLADSVARVAGVPAARAIITENQSDHAMFASVGIPALMLTSGFHADYHRVTDVAARIDVPGVTRIVDVAEGIVRAAATRMWLPRATTSPAIQ